MTAEDKTLTASANLKKDKNACGADGDKHKNCQ